MHSVIIVSAGTGSRYINSAKPITATADTTGSREGITPPVLKTLEPLPREEQDGYADSQNFQKNSPRMPVFIHSLLLFADPIFTEIILVLASEEVEKNHHNLPGSFAYLLEVWQKKIPAVDTVIKKLTIVAGGKERYQSVANGLKHVNETSNYVWIHDAARPLLHPDDLNLLLTAVEGQDGSEGSTANGIGGLGVLPVQFPTHSIKAVNEAGLVTANIPRHTLREASTPQIFPTVRLKAIYQKLLNEYNDSATPTSIPTDDSELYFAAGYEVQTVTLCHPNPKLTVVSDHAYMSELWKERQAHNKK